MYINLSELVQGDKIKVIKEFTDFDGQIIRKGSEWTFSEYSYFVYDGGNTFSFEEGEMRMAEISPDDYYVLSHANEFFILVNKEIKDTWTFEEPPTQGKPNTLAS